jgi:subtilisin-like proprotein convertase family protein
MATPKQKEEQMKASRTIFMGLALLCILALTPGCGGGGGKDCEGVADLCEGELDSLRCSDDDSAIQICQENEDGCPVWTDQTPCGAGEACDDSGTTPVCACEDLCTTLDATRCSGTLVQTCETAASGCLDWAETEDCADAGQICQLVGGTAQCVEGCTDECAAMDTRRCSGDVIQVCQAGTDGCLDWVDEADCTLTGEVCDDSGAEPVCAAGCTDECDTAAATQCSGDVIQTCTEGTDGCLDWVDGVNCAATAETCDDSSGTAECVCADECTLAETRCNMTVIQTCENGTEGCTVWADTTDCGALDLACDDTAEPAVCTGGGDSCADVQVITSLPFEKSGTDFTVDYGDDVLFTDDSCYDRPGTQADAVLAVQLTTGDILYVEERGGLDAVVSVQAVCGNDEACLVSEDDGYTDAISYTATADGMVYIIVEAYDASPTSVDYDIIVQVGSAEACGDAVDNDFDGLVDCDDPDCFGDATSCTVETNCHDDADNDGDTAVDCDDSDCTSSEWCAPYKGYWQEFGTSDPVDLEGHSIVFTPEASDPNLYTWAESDGVTAYAVTPGTGTTTAALTLGDSAFATHAITTATSFTFFGAAYTTLYVGSNGSITFGAGDRYNCYDTGDFFDFARIAVFDDDLDPSAAGTITVDEFSDRIVVTWDGVPDYWDTAAVNSFQAVLHGAMSTTPGVIELYYVDLSITDDGMAGISSGAGNGTIPDETDFVPPPPPPPPVINEVSYDNPGTDTQEFVEIRAQVGLDMSAYTLVHFNGSTGLVVWALPLTGVTVPADGFLVVGAAAVPNVDVALPGAIQNDGETVVLYTGWDGTTGTVIDAVAWETDTFLFGEGNPSTGVTSGNWATSIGRYPDGADTNDNLTDFPVGWWTTPGEPNTPASPANHARIVSSAQFPGSMPVAIPDNDATGVTATMTVDPTWTWFPDTITNIHVGVRITHTWIGDLEVSLTNPAGTTTVMLHDNSGGSADDIMTVYDLGTAVDDTANSMASFDGQTTAGDWTLHVVDSSSGDTGTLVDWILFVEGT